MLHQQIKEHACKCLHLLMERMVAKKIKFKKPGLPFYSGKVASPIFRSGRTHTLK